MSEQLNDQSYDQAYNPTPIPRRIRTGTIVWGSILLFIAAVAFAVRFVDPDLYGSSLLVWNVVAIGGLLVAIGIIGAIIRLATRRSHPPIG